MYVKCQYYIIIEIKFEEKNHCQGDNEDEEKEDFNDYHYKYSLKLIFNKKTNESERKREEKMITRLKSYGIIVDFDEKLNSISYRTRFNHKVKFIRLYTILLYQQEN